MLKPGTVFVLAIALAALAASLVYRELRSQDEALELARRANREASRPIVVAREAIPVGTRITQEMVTTIPWAVGAEPAGATADPGTVVGAFAKATIEKNLPVVRTALADDGPGLLSPMIADGMRAMSVKVDGVTGVSGFITPGSRVDVLVAGEGSEGAAARSKLILQNVKVLATGRSVEQKDEAPVEVPTVTLLVTPEDAERLTLASRYEPVQLALRGAKDQDVVATPGTSAQALFGGVATAAAPAAEPALAEAPRPRRGGGYSIEVLLRGKSTRQAVF